jgi:AcrR family transcriptional regulator
MPGRASRRYPWVPMPADRDPVYEAQHARLLEGLAASIREKGLAQTQVADIVRHAHASRRTFYKHFPDKDSCFVELTDALSVLLLERVDQAIERDAPLEVQIEQAIDTYVDILVDEPNLTATWASPSLGERVIIAQREGVERYAQLLVSVLAADAERDPGVEPVSLERAYMVVSGVQQAIIRAVARGQDLIRLAAEIKAFMKAVLVPQAARLAPTPTVSRGSSDSSPPKRMWSPTGPSSRTLRSRR